MADVQYKLNFPIVTPEAYAFWESRHRLNRIKAIMAFSLDKDNANDNLRRAGYYRQYRKRYLELYDCIIAQPDMQNIPLSDLTEHWWDPIAICPLVPVGPVALGIKTNPVDVTALEGTTATFSVEAKGGTAPYTYQWEYSLMLANWVNASGGTSQTYSPTVETNTDGLHYRCVIKDAAGATVTSGYGKLTMIPKLAWDAHPATGTIGTDLDFSWTGGTAPFTVVVLNPAGTEHDRATHTSPYTLKTTNQADGEWTVTVEDSSVTKQTVTQKVQMAAVAAPTTYFFTQNNVKSNSHYPVRLDPVNKPSDWVITTPNAGTLYMGIASRNISDDSTVTGNPYAGVTASSSDETIVKVDNVSANGGGYQLHGQNKVGDATVSFTLNGNVIGTIHVYIRAANDFPAFTTDLDETVQAITTATPIDLTIVATDSDTPITYQWKRLKDNNTEWRDQGQTIVDGSGVTGATTPHLNITTPEVGTWYYRCYVSDAKTPNNVSVSKSAHFTVTTP